MESSSSSLGYRPQAHRTKTSSASSTNRSTSASNFDDARSGNVSLSPDAGIDLTRRPQKHRRRDRSAAKAPDASLQVNLPPRPKPLALRHTPPTRDAAGQSARLLQWRRDHRKFLLGTTFQGAALGAVGGGATGAIAGLVSNVSGGVPFGSFFNGVACAASLADIYQAKISAEQAHEMYMEAHVALAEQRQLLDELNGRLQGGPPLPEDASLRDLANSLIQQFEGFIQSYHQAFFWDAGALHVQRASKALQAQAGELVALKAEYDRCGDESQQHRLWTRAQDVRASLQERLSSGQMKKDLRARLTQARNELEHKEDEALQRRRSHGMDVAQRIGGYTIELEHGHITAERRSEVTQLLAEARRWQREEEDDQRAIEQLRQEIRDLKDDLKRLDSWPRRVVLAPFGDSGPAELARVRDEVLGSLKLLVELSATGNSMAAVFGAAIFSSINLLFPAWVLDLFSGRIDIKGGKHGMAAAAAAKRPVIDRGAYAAALCQAYGQLADVRGRACQYPLRAMTLCAGRQLNFLHHTSRINKERKLHGLKAIVNGLLLLGTGVVTALTGVPVVAGPAVAGGTTSVAYLIDGVKYYVELGADKHDRKQDEAVALALVRLFGPQAPDEFYRDMAEGYTHRWDKRLEMLRQQLRATPDGRDLDPKLLQPHALASNPWLAIEHLGQALYVRARDHGIGTPTIESQLVTQLAEAQGKADPGAWDPKNFPSPELYLQQVRQSLSELYGLQPDPEDHLPLQDPRKLADIATSVNGWIERHFNQKNALSEDGTLTLQGWINRVANEPEAFGKRLAELRLKESQRLREQLNFLGRKLREQGIGPRELYALQAHSVQPPAEDGQHPLQHAPQLRESFAPYLLELIADPSWLDTTAAPAPPAVQPAASTDETRMAGHLTKAFKDVGRSRRDGSPVRRPTPLGDQNRAAAEPRHVRLGRWMGQRPAAIGKHLHQQRANPLGTPDRAIKELHRLEKKPNATELQVLMQQILVALAREVGGPGLVLPKDSDVMASLPDDASDADVKRAHILALLKMARNAAQTTAAGIPEKATGRARDIDGQKQLKARMTDTYLLCVQLTRLVEAQESVGAILAPIEVR
jgi:chaperonin cofactor prefoldin